jgi:hypothetical protein
MIGLLRAVRGRAINIGNIFEAITPPLKRFKASFSKFLLHLPFLFYSIDHPFYKCDQDKDDKFYKMTGGANCTHKFGHLSKCKRLGAGDQESCHFEPRYV